MSAMSDISTSPSPKDPSLILVVDDDKSMRMVLRKAMEKEGYQVAEANNGEEALAIFQQRSPDMILLDALMPVMDGFTCCAKLQVMPGGDCTPVLMITGLEDQVSVDRAFEAGAVDYVTKPIHWAVLRQRVRRILRELQLSRQLAQAYQELQQLASLDGLTQVANRRRFDEYLDQEWKRMVRDQGQLSLILCDVDFFKAYNDAYGHPAGDRCLQQIARAISLAVKRPADLVARYGGEEFVVTLPNTNTNGAVQVAQEIRAHVQALGLVHKHSQASEHVTLSLGVASAAAGGESSPSLLIAEADKALYQAKATGRDSVQVAAWYAVGAY